MAFKFEQSVQHLQLVHKGHAPGHEIFLRQTYTKFALEHYNRPHHEEMYNAKLTLNHLLHPGLAFMSSAVTVVC